MSNAASLNPNNAQEQPQAKVGKAVASWRPLDDRSGLKLWVADLPLLVLEVEHIAGKFCPRVLRHDQILQHLAAGKPCATLAEAQQEALRMASQIMLEALPCPEAFCGQGDSVDVAWLEMKLLAELMRRIHARSVAMEADRVTAKLTDESLSGIRLTAAIRLDRKQLHLRVDRGADAGGSAAELARPQHLGQPGQVPS